MDPHIRRDCSVTNDFFHSEFLCIIIHLYLIDTVELSLGARISAIQAKSGSCNGWESTCSSGFSIILNCYYVPKSTPVPILYGIVVYVIGLI